MIKKRGGSQIGNLTFNHKSLESRGQMRSDWKHVIHHWKDIFKVYKILSLYSQKILLIWKRYECPKFWVNKNFSFGTPTWESRGKVTFGCNPYGEAQSILYGGEWCLLPKVVSHVDLVFEIVPTKSIAPFPFDLH